MIHKLILPIFVFGMLSSHEGLSRASSTESKKPTKKSPSKQDALRMKTKLTQEKVLEVADQQAEKAGHKLQDFSTPKITQEIRKGQIVWTVFYDGKVAAPGNHFSVEVLDATGAATVVPGE